jgi:serine/threonine protein kinase
MAEPAQKQETCLGSKLGKKLGAGGFAFVREATARDGKKVAIKFLKMDTAERALDKRNNAIVAVDEHGAAMKNVPGRLKRSLKEITTELMALQMCKSENVVKLYKYKLNHPYRMSNGTTWNSLAMVLEICENGELFDLVYHGQPLQEKIARTFFRQIVNGLEALHKKNMAHRDIKPQNILLTKDFVVKLADMGSGARFRDSRLMKTCRVGTRGFQAPELLCGKSYSKKCDTFSLGVTLFVLLSKTMPCREEATIQDPLYVFMAANRYDEYWEKFRRGGINFSDDLKLLLQGMLAYQPANRFQIDDYQRTPDSEIITGIKNSSWYNGDIFTQDELKSELQDHYLVARAKRNKLRNPETEIHSVSFRSGKAIPLPHLPPDREYWAEELDPEVLMGEAGEKLHPDYLLRCVIQKFEVQDGRCKTNYVETQGQLQLLGEITKENPIPYQVNINAYEKDGMYYLDFRPTVNFHHPSSQALVKDVQQFLRSGI